MWFCCDIAHSPSKQASVHHRPFLKPLWAWEAWGASTNETRSPGYSFCPEELSALPLTQESHVFWGHLWNSYGVVCRLAQDVKSQLCTVLDRHLVAGFKLQLEELFCPFGIIFLIHFLPNLITELECRNSVIRFFYIFPNCTSEKFNGFTILLALALGKQERDWQPCQIKFLSLEKKFNWYRMMYFNCFSLHFFNG